MTHMACGRKRGVMFGAFCMLLLGAGTAFAQVMQSTNYQIEFDSINVAGGSATATSYIIEDTVGEIATGPSGSMSYSLRAGYQQMNETYLAISAAADVTLVPSLGGITGGVANGTTTTTVITDNLAGYQLFIQASTSPALVHTGTSSAFFVDYMPATSTIPDYVFTYTPSQATFAFSVAGVDTAPLFRDNGILCATGSLTTNNTCWFGLATSSTVVASRSTPNHPEGTETELVFRAGLGANVVQLAGLYRATTTLTAIAQ